MTDEKLLPCPFCKGNASISQGQIGAMRAIAYYIECIECAASSDMSYSVNEAIVKWNTRA